MATERTILITGGAGFLGSNFVRRLFYRYPGYRIRVLDALTYAGNLANLEPAIRNDERFEFWQGNVRNAALVHELVAQVDAVIHFAAETHVARSIHDDRKFFDTDVMGTQVVAGAVLKHQDRIERFIHVSTSEVYGTAVTTPMSEDHPLNPLTPYAAAKTGADRLVYSYIQTYDVPALILRPFNQYGPYQHLEKVVPRFITSALLDEPLTIHGTGEARRDWVFVEDTCQWIDRALHAPLDSVRGEVINLGSGRSLSVLDLGKMILSLLHRPLSLLSFMADRPGQVQHHLAATQKARDLLHIDSITPLEKGLAKTIAWYRDNRGWWEKQIAMRRVAIRRKGGKILYY